MGLLSDKTGPSLGEDSCNLYELAVKVATEQDNPKYCKEVAKYLYRFRRRRDDIFPKRLFSDPAWDILLDLYISEVEGKKISITSACAASNVPLTTALRWIGVLEDRGLVIRYDDPTDNRRSFVRITGEVAYKITKLISDF